MSVHRSMNNGLWRPTCDSFLYHSLPDYILKLILLAIEQNIEKYFVYKTGLRIFNLS